MAACTSLYAYSQNLVSVADSTDVKRLEKKNIPNEIIATPIGGAALGEVFYRSSDLILDDRATGGERFGRELAAFILNPMRGISRVITGEAWKKRVTSGRNRHRIWRPLCRKHKSTL